MTNSELTKTRAFRMLSKLIRRRFVRELLIVFAFTLLTAIMTWPYVTRMRDAVAGRNDPYLTAYVMWWDYHATFTHPLNLFHPTIFYPYRYALAFSEHCYGIALLFFPLYALGCRPLTVHAVAAFFGFALSGYGAFRLARTLTDSNESGWICGIIFAFVPYRFGMIGQLMYLFSPWVPLLFEALVLFTRERSAKRAVWLGVAFFMLGLSTISWFLWSLVPLAACTAILLTRYRLWRERHFWQRAALALGSASLALMPFMAPYFIAARIYGFKRRFDEVRAHSATPMHWLVADEHNNVWHGLGKNIYESYKFQMFPGLVALLLPLSEFFLIGAPKIRPVSNAADESRAKWVKVLDVLVVVTFVLSVLALGFDSTDAFGQLFFRYLRSERLLALLIAAVIARLCFAYPQFMRRGEGANLIATIRSERRSDAFWIGILLTVIGFFYSIGWNSFFYRFLYEAMPGFKSMRAPMRGALFAYLGLALLGGLGAKRLAERFSGWRDWVPRRAVYAVIAVLFLLEVNPWPFFFIRGEVYPDAVTLRLKDTTMRGGVAYLPYTLDINHQYTLRAADHLKPIISGTSSFNPPYFDQIDKLTNSGTIPLEYLDLLESIPASYLVIENHLIEPARKPDFIAFISAALGTGRLRFIRRFDGHNDLYALTRIEPSARTEEQLPAELNLREWGAMIKDDPTNLVLRNQQWAQTVWRMYLASFGEMPRFKPFMTDTEKVAAGVIMGLPAEQSQLETNLREFAAQWVQRPEFIAIFERLDNAQFLDRLAKNAGLVLTPAERQQMLDELGSGQANRTSVLLQLVRNPRFVEKEDARSLVALHYFAFLHRNPGDPPDHDLDGFNFWIHDFERFHDAGQLARAFADSQERKTMGGP